MCSFQITFKIQILIAFLLASTISCAPTKEAKSTLLKGIAIVHSNSTDVSLAQIYNDEIHVAYPVRSFAEKCKAPNHIFEFKFFLYLTCSLTNDVHILDKISFQPMYGIVLDDGDNPLFTHILSDSVAAVSSLSENKIVFINPQPRKISKSKRHIGELSIDPELLKKDPGVTTLPRPGGMASSDSLLFVALANLNHRSIAGGPGYVAVIDPETQSLSKLIELQGRNTTSVHIRNHELFAVNTGSSQDGKGYVGDGSIDVIDIHTLERTHHIPLKGSPSDLVFVESRGEAFLGNGSANTLLRIDLESKTVLDPLPVDVSTCAQNIPTDMRYVSAMLIDESRLWITEFNTNCLVVFDLETLTRQHHIKTGGIGPDLLIKL